MTRGFLTRITAAGSRAVAPHTRTAVAAYQGTVKCALACALAAFCCTGGAGWAWGQTGSPAGAAAQGSTAGEAQAQAASPAMPVAGEAMLYPGEDFKLGAGDLIAVRVFGQGDYQATVRVDADGNVLLPFIGSVNVKGLTVRAAQLLIADRLRAGQFYRNPEVTIQVMDTVNGAAIVTGEIHGVVPVATERSLREVLLMAGGLPGNCQPHHKDCAAGAGRSDCRGPWHGLGIQYHGQHSSAPARHHPDHAGERGLCAGSVSTPGPGSAGPSSATYSATGGCAERRYGF